YTLVGFGDPLQPVPHLAAFGNEVVVWVDNDQRGNLFFVGNSAHGDGGLAVDYFCFQACRSMLFAKSGVSCRLCASEIGRRADRKTSKGIPCWARKPRSSGVASL